MTEKNLTRFLGHNEHPEEQAPDLNEAPGEDSPVSPKDETIIRKLKVIHANLGHPSNDVMVRMLRDAKASPRVLEEAKKFSCIFCRSRGRPGPKRPSAPSQVTQKWHTVSVDTFWWHSPHKRADGSSMQHCVGISFLDEATDFHVARVVRFGHKKQGNINAKEFQNAFLQDWVRVLPTPSVLRFDDEGCFRNQALLEWIEGQGIVPHVIAGESPWQNGKRSRHLEVLKENMSLLASEKPPDMQCTDILSLALGAKNELHQIRGYAPNQWAFGQAKGRLESMLQQGENLTLQSRRDQASFEEQVQSVLKARETFLKADAKRRLQRAARRQARRVENFECGNLVYFWRRGKVSDDGLWHGPGRVVCVEKTGDGEANQTPGSVVWVSYGIVLYRCSPEQLRHVTHAVAEIHSFMHENMTPSEVLRELRGSMNYRDIRQDVANLPEDHVVHDEEPMEARQPSPEAQARPAEDLPRRLSRKTTPAPHDLAPRRFKSQTQQAQQRKEERSLTEVIQAARDQEFEDLAEKNQTTVKCSGKTFATILAEHPDYIVWLLDNHKKSEICQPPGICPPSSGTEDGGASSAHNDPATDGSMGPPQESGDVDRESEAAAGHEPANRGSTGTCSQSTVPDRPT